MAAAQRFCVAEERSGHCAVMDRHCLYVWGGYVTIEENEVYLPHDEIWVYDTESGLWQMHLTHGDLPPSMSGSCGACLNGRLYIFGGYDDKGYSNQLYYVDLRPGTGEFTWKQVKHFKGQPPTARDKLSCWVYKRQLIYFGGYGSRRHHELNDCFDVHDASWEGQMFWGWNNDINVFDTEEQAWTQPMVKSTPPPARAAHSCALLGNNGYVFGGRVLQTRMNDLHVLNLDTWTWSGGLWHTACAGSDHEVMVFGGSKDDLLSLDTGHCNDLLIFQTQPLPLLRLCLDCIGKNAFQLRNQLSCLPQKLLQQVRKRITFWAAARFRQSRREGYEINNKS
ncbi:kelch domain-containing protein 1 isoform X4 [Ranitomeya variabilis]|uniref:kelch domain-containing protein 1 isoform X4 n=1 Tax=Ranitomeya variabilis TaxID=490064 RepID=UPI004056F122